MGRIARKDVFDSVGAGTAERTSYLYDDAGRTTQALLQRVNSSGAVISSGTETNATYDQYGNTATHRSGTQLASTFTYDPGAMGYLDQTLRGDGDLEEYQQDAFGRDAMVRQTFAPGSTGQRDFAFAHPGGEPPPIAWTVSLCCHLLELLAHELHFELDRAHVVEC